MKIYFFLNIATVLLPLLFSFEPKIKFYRKFPVLFPAILFVATLYIFWDMVAVFNGDWYFNPAYLLGVWVGNIPLEEVVFFIVTPFSCLFIYEALGVYGKEAELKISLRSFWLLAGVFMLGALLSRNYVYSRTVLAFCALSVALTLLAKPNILRSRNYWSFIAITFIPFLLINSILTGLPVVSYNPAAIWGPRFLTIPLEDFFYSFSLLSFNFLVYSCFNDMDAARNRLRKSAEELFSPRRML